MRGGGLLIAMILLAGLALGENRRLEFGPGDLREVPTEEAIRLSSGGHKYMDVTDYPTLGSAVVPPSTEIPSDLHHRAAVERVASHINATHIVEDLKKLQEIYTRFYTTPTGIQAAIDIAEEYKTIAAHHKHEHHHVTVELFKDVALPQDSVIVRLHGKGEHRHERVILGGHLDSIAGEDGLDRAPGADDDGSGIMTGMETFRALLKSGVEFDRTIEIHAYAAEEVGLRGSQAVAAHYALHNISVRAMVQFDMTGYVKNKANPEIGIITDYTAGDLNAFVRKCIDSYTDAHWADSKCGYACSDHASWTKAGYPSAFPFEGKFENSDPFIHSANDLVAHLSEDHLNAFAHLGVGVLVELATPHPST